MRAEARVFALSVFVPGASNFLRVGQAIPLDAQRDKSDNLRHRMRLVEIMTEDRVIVTRGLSDKATALDAIAALLAKGTPSKDVVAVRAVLAEREGLQSTGIGDGVAIPHGFLVELTTQVAALIIVPGGVDFEAIDSKPARIILGVVGPKRGMHAQVEHLRILARVSKVLREPNLREKMLSATSSASVFELLREADARVP
jgi:PTS system nitrogen regulatory IIA component